MKDIMPRLSARFEEALAYAAKLHEHQLRQKTKIPYVASGAVCGRHK